MGAGTGVGPGTGVIPATTTGPGTGVVIVSTGFTAPAPAGAVGLPAHRVLGEPRPYQTVGWR